MKGQDILLLLKLVAIDDDAPPYHRLASELDLSPSQVHEAARRSERAGLLLRVDLDGARQGKRPNRTNLLEFLLHGLPYVFPAEWGPETRGLPTAWSAPVFDGRLVVADDSAVVWPMADGTVRGTALQPLHRAATQAARLDRRLYDLLALVDAIRAGRARERRIATELLTELLSTRASS